MEKLLVHLPDKIVADDITNFLLEKPINICFLIFMKAELY